MSYMYLAHHDLESIFMTIVVTATIHCQNCHVRIAVMVARASLLCMHGNKVALKDTGRASFTQVIS